MYSGLWRGYETFTLQASQVSDLKKSTVHAEVCEEDRVGEICKRWKRCRAASSREPCRSCAHSQ